MFALVSVWLPLCLQVRRYVCLLVCTCLLEPSSVCLLVLRREAVLGREAALGREAVLGRGAASGREAALGRELCENPASWKDIDSKADLQDAR